LVDRKNYEPERQLATQSTAFPKFDPYGAGRKRPLAVVPGGRHCSHMTVARRAITPFSFAVGATAVLVAGCADAQQQVAGHLYNVPSANLISKSAYPFFLPKSQDDGFIFILNPEAELRQQRTVLVQEREAVCARANGAGYVSRTICGPRQVKWKGHGWVRKGDETFWTYSPDTPSHPDAPFISCHSMEIKGHPGLCSATLTFDGLVLTIGLNDDELPGLETTYQRAVSMLRSWEA
jgi:hypothetical protein